MSGISRLFTIAASFVATRTSTAITFAMRDDAAFLGLDDVSVSAGAGPNMLLNPGFELGPVGSSTPIDWTYLNPFGVSTGGAVSTAPSPGPHSGSNYYSDGAFQGYDLLSQTIPTVPGDLYSISFWLRDNSAVSRTFSALDTTPATDSGVDLLVYAGAIPFAVPAAEPEPPTAAPD